MAVVAALVMTAGMLTACDASPVVLEGDITYRSSIGVAETATSRFAPGVTVTLYDATTETPVSSTTTNLVGHYEFHSSTVRNDTYRLRIDDDWYGGTSWATASTIDLDSAASTSVDHAIDQAGSLSGTIVESTGTPATAAVWALDESGAVVATTFTDTEGSFTLGIPAEGTYTVAIKGAEAARVNVGGPAATTFTVDSANPDIALGTIDVATGLAPAAPWSTSVSVTAATAADGLTLEVSGTGFTDLPVASTGSPNQGVYVALRDPATMPDDAINADTSIVPAVNFVYKGTITGGNFTTTVNAAAADLDPDATYEIIVWVAHGNITPATLLTTTPVTLTPEQHAALFG